MPNKVVFDPHAVKIAGDLIMFKLPDQIEERMVSNFNGRMLEG
jgi:hypothetical protein